MPQEIKIHSLESIIDYLRRVTGIADVEANMTISTEAFAEYERRDGFSFYYRVQVMMEAFGLSNLSLETTINLLSPGERSKVFIYNWITFV